MTASLGSLSCREFSDALASKAAVPGGGGAAALMGALGSALCAMAGNLTIGKKKFADVEWEIKLIVIKAEELKDKFLKLIDEDAAAFEPLSKAYSMPKDSPDYSKIMREVTLNACRAPMEMMECCGKALMLLQEISDKCSKLMISDVACGAIAAKAALQSASYNVFVNTKSLPNDPDAAALEKRADELLKEFTEIADLIAENVLNELRRK